VGPALLLHRGRKEDTKGVPAWQPGWHKVVIKTGRENTLCEAEHIEGVLMRD